MPVKVKFLIIQRALRLLDGLARHTVRINHRSPDVPMAQKCLNRANVIIGLQEMGGKRMVKGVGGNALRELCPSHGFIEGLLNMGIMKMIPP